MLTAAAWFHQTGLAQYPARTGIGKPGFAPPRRLFLQTNRPNTPVNVKNMIYVIVLYDYIRSAWVQHGPRNLRSTRTVLAIYAKGDTP
jgi:hypothetical protein